MAYSIVTHPGDGSTTTFPINFTLGFISRDDVRCRVGSEVDGLGDPVYRALTWITDGLVQVQGAPAALGVNVEFTRTVDKDQLIHDYSDGAAITESNLDDSNKQVIMMLHEFLDDRIRVLPTSDLDMNAHKITNLANGTDAQDAVTVTQAAQAIALTPVAVQAAANAASALVAAEAAQADAEAAAANAASALVAAEAAQADAEAAAANAAANAAGALASAMLKSQNLNDVADKATARTNLDVYDKASVYTKTEAYAKSEVYTKTEAYAKSEVYTKAEVNAAVTAIPKTPSGTQLFTSSGTFVVPADVTGIYLTLVGGGGGGAGGNGTWGSGGGGASGSHIIKKRLFVTAGATFSISIGAGGWAGGNTDIGAQGGTTSFGSISAQGGFGGIITNTLHTGGSFATDGQLNWEGRAGAGVNAVGGRGGASMFGTSGSPTTSNAGAGSGYGVGGTGGGGTGGGGTWGSAGMAGMVLVEW